MTTPLNVSDSGMSAASAFPAMSGVLITIIIFVLLVGIIFIISLQFRKTLIGAVITGVLFGIFKFSRWAARDYVAGDPWLVNGTIRLAVFIIVSWIIGSVLMKIEKIRDLFKGE